MSPSLIITTVTALLLVFLSTTTTATAAVSAAKTKPFEKIYAFGDSLTDTGNTVSATGPNGFTYVSNPPYGRTFFHRPTNRYSDGRLVIDFVAEYLSLPLLPPYLDKTADTSSGVNYAVAGCTAIPHGFFVKNNITIDITPQSLETQLSWFSRTLEGHGCKSAVSTPAECEAVFGEALVWVGEIGANDYAYTVGSNVSEKTVQSLAVRSLTGFLETLLNKGAKYMVVEGLPATGCLTLSMALAPTTDRDDLGCVASQNRIMNAHNAIMQTNIENLRKQFPGAVIVYADFWNAYRTVIKSPTKYGFKELYKVCCGAGSGSYNFDLFSICGSSSASSCQDPSQYINWDGVHLTEAMNKVVSDMFLNGEFTRPPFEFLLSSKEKSG